MLRGCGFYFLVRALAGSVLAQVSFSYLERRIFITERFFIELVKINEVGRGSRFMEVNVSKVLEGKIRIQN